MDANEGNQRSSVGRKASAGPIRGPGGGNGFRSRQQSDVVQASG